MHALFMNTKYNDLILKTNNKKPSFFQTTTAVNNHMFLEWSPQFFEFVLLGTFAFLQYMS